MCVEPIRVRLHCLEGLYVGNLGQVRIAASIIALTVGGCVPDTAGPSAEADSGSNGLAGSAWRPTEVGGVAVPAETEAFVTFGADGRFAGDDGCNHFSGDYEADDASIAFGEVRMTLMVCGWLSEPERLFHQGMAGATSYERTGTALTLFGATGDQAVVLVPTTAE